jgi:hypothetical protein
MTSSPFDNAVARAIVCLRQVEEQLRRWRIHEHSLDGEYHLLHLTSLAVLAGQRGQHLLGKLVAEHEPSSGPNVAAALTRAHEDLVAQFPGATEIVAFQFVTEVGGVLQGVHDYVERC